MLFEAKILVPGMKHFCAISAVSRVDEGKEEEDSKEE